jgi:hypothetical protein
LDQLPSKSLVALFIAMFREALLAEAAQKDLGPFP